MLEKTRDLIEKALIEAGYTITGKGSDDDGAAMLLSFRTPQDEMGLGNLPQMLSIVDNFTE
jgi:hypothetical protein